MTKTLDVRLDFLLPLAPVVVALLGVLPLFYFFSGPKALAVALILVGLALAAAYWLRSRVRDILAAFKDLEAERWRLEQGLLDRDLSLTNLERLSLEFFPIWKRQIDTSVEQGVASIDAMTLKFSQLAANLQQVLGNIELSRTTTEVSQALKEDKKSLEDLFRDLASMLVSSEQMSIGMESLEDLSRELDDMALQVGKLANQTNTLSLNAALEAARIGEKGRNFALVADRVHDLSTQTAETSQGIGDQVGNLGQALRELFQKIESSHQHEAVNLAEGEESLYQVMDGLGEQARILQTEGSELLSLGQEMTTEIEELLTALQFQDRVSQILRQVGTSLDSIYQVISEQAALRAQGQLPTRFDYRYIA